MSVDLKNLSKLISLCRKAGVSDLEIDGIKLKLSGTAPKSSYKKRSSGPDLKIEPPYSDEDALFWSSQGAM